MIYVYQMGRVASRSVVAELRRRRYEIWDFHSLAPGMNIDGTKLGGNHSPDDCTVRENARKVLANVDAETKVITIVRDPLVRCISSYCHHWHDHIYPNRSFEDFINNYPFDWVLDWFDNEIKKYVGVDIYQTKFEKDKKYSVTKCNGNTLLTARTDGIRAGLSSLFGTNFNPLPRTNSANKTSSYSKFMSEFTPPEHLLDKIYGSKMVEFFYSPEEVSVARQRWTK